MEGLSFLPSRTAWTAAGERGMAEDFVSESGGVASRVQASVVPTLRKERKEPALSASKGTGALALLVMPGKVKSLGHPPV